MERERLSEPMTYREFLARFENLEAGQSFQYHAGELAHDRLFSYELNRIAERALLLGTSCLDEVRPNINGHVGHLKDSIVLGKGEAILLQRKNCLGSEYYIIKKSLPF